jgi:hypothetical protein
MFLMFLFPGVYVISTNVFAVAGVPVFTGVPVFAGVTSVAVFPLVLASVVAGVPAVARQCCGSGSGIRCFFNPWIRDPGSGMAKKSGSGSGMNNPDHISERLETFFLVKIL